MQQSFIKAKKQRAAAGLNGKEAAGMMYGGLSRDNARELIGKKPVLTPEDLAIYSEPSTETALQDAFVNWLAIHYPDALFLASAGGIFLPIGYAKKLKRQGVIRKGYPDFYLWKRVGEYSGLVMDFKVFGEKLKTKKGTWVSDHVAEQAAVLEQFRREGWAAEFAVGLLTAKKMTEKFLKGEWDAA